MKKTTRQRGNIVIGLIIGLVLGLGVALGIAVYVTKVPIPFVTKTQKGGAEQDEAEARKNRDWDPNAPLAGKAGAAKPTPPAATGPVNPSPASRPPAPPPSHPATAAPGRRAGARGGRAQADARGARAGRSQCAAGVERSAGRPCPCARGHRFGQHDRGIRRAEQPCRSAFRCSRVFVGADPFMYFVQAGAFRTTDDAEAQRAKLSLMGVEARVTEREQAGRTVYRVRAGPFNKKDDADRLKERLDGGGLESALVRVQR
jgi:cell division protein FtsN